MREEISKILELLCSTSKLSRDKGYLELKSAIQNKLKNTEEDGTFIQELENECCNFISLNQSLVKWEDVHGYLVTIKTIIETNVYSSNFPKMILDYGVECLKHDEFRVRIRAGELLGALCQFVDKTLYSKFQPVLITSIQNNLTRELDIADEISNEICKDAKEIFHETAGWKNIETSMKGLKCVIEGCGETFLEFLDNDLLDLIFQTLKHINRFVRETGYYVFASLARYGVSSHQNCNRDIIIKLTEYLRIGLADNWSQVRLAASVATRQFFEDINEIDKKIYLQKLLPPMCLNRYYLAEGVKLYSQESWRLILGTEGRSFVQEFIKDVVEFYIEQTVSDNHAVREAACHCIAELGLKINKEAVRPYVTVLLDALFTCFKDESWPVRDTACTACGNFVFSFPQECKPYLQSLFPLFFENLGDPIPSVRQGGAIALSNVVKGYESESFEEIKDKITLGLKSIEQQSATSERYEGLDKGLSTYGVVKQLRDNDFELHTNQQMYSCGSLAPKMKRGAGCMDHSFKRKSEPWEIADGCLYLVCELSGIEKMKETVTNMLPLIVEACGHKHYTHHIHFYESVNKVLPVIAKRLGKRVFKQYLEQFFQIIFASLTCENNLTKSAAVDCLLSLGDLLGKNILHGRVEQYDVHYSSLLDDVLNGKFNRFPS